MNFKDEFNKECNNITASDELINRTLMAAMTQDYNKTDNNINNDMNMNTNNRNNDINSINYKSNCHNKISHTNSKKKNILRIIASAAAIAIICFAAYSIYSITNTNGKNSTSTPVLKVYAGENNEELGTKGLSLAYSKDSPYGITNIFGWGNDNVSSITTLQFDLNIQLGGTTSSIKRITLTSSSPDTNILTTLEVPEEIINNNYKITEEYGMKHSLYRPTDDSSYAVRSKYDSKEKYIYIDHKNTYSASYSDFENLYLNFKLSNTNSVSTQLVLSVEYEDGSIVNRTYKATAYASELYMFIREAK